MRMPSFHNINFVAMYRITFTNSYIRNIYSPVFIVLLFIIFYFINTNYRLNLTHNYVVLTKSAVTFDTTRKVVKNEGKNIEMKYILLWTNPRNVPFLYFGEGQSVFVNKNCKWTNCYVTGDKNYLGDYTEFDVIAFNGPQLQNLLRNNDLPRRRFDKQKYVYANIESAATYPICDRVWNGFFNWTWTYKLSSTTVWRYFVIKNIHGLDIGPRDVMHWRNLYSMKAIDNALKLKLKSKTKAAAWFVSNCNTFSLREEYVNEIQEYLQKYNLDVHIYGECGKYKCPKKIMDRCLRMVEQDYFFYFAFENSLSEDYVTEKILYALNSNAVPVVFGGANYTRFMPHGTYLNALELGPEKLAHKMYQIIQNPAQYHNFFRWQKYYSYHRTHESPDTDVYCQFCAAVNDAAFVNSNSVYKNFDSWWTGKDACHDL